MDMVLWQTLAGTRGGPNRARILATLDERPRNANQLAEEMDLAYNTVRYHLDVLEENGILTSGDTDYGAVYLPSDRTKANWDTVEQIISQVTTGMNSPHTSESREPTADRDHGGDQS